MTNKLTFLSIKDIMRILGCGKNVASKIRFDIAKEYAIKRKQVTYEHLKKYLKLEG